MLLDPGISFELGTEVFDIMGEKIGRVAKVHRGGASSEGRANRYAAQSRRDRVEIETGRPGLGKRLYVPVAAATQLNSNQIVLSLSRDDIEFLNWHRRPADLEDRSEGERG